MGRAVYGGAERRNSEPDTVLRHAELLGALSSKVETMSGNIGSLFSKTDELTEIAIKNGTNIDHIRAKIDNGFFKELEDNISAMCEKISAKSLQFTSDIADLQRKVKDMDEKNWFQKFLDAGAKKIILATVGVLFLVALSNAMMWGFIKAEIFKETPKLMQTISKGVQR